MLMLFLSPSYTPSQADVVVFKAISAAPSASANPSVARWYTHIKSYEAEFGSLSGSSSAGEAFLGGASAAAPAKAEEDDEDIDLFGSDDEEDAEAERIKAERVAAYNAKKAAKPKTVAKVRLISRLCCPPPTSHHVFPCHVCTILWKSMLTCCI